MIFSVQSPVNSLSKLAAQQAYRGIQLIAIATLTFALGACTNTNPAPKAASDLVDTTKGNFDHVMMRPGTTIKPFSKVFIEEPKVTFNKFWLTDFRNDYTDRDLERITRTYGEMLKEALAEGLTEDTQIAVVNDASEADVIFRPLLSNLNIYAPDLSNTGITKRFAWETGNATLDLTLVDANNGEVVAQFVDHRETSANISDRLERANRGTNARYFRFLMERWTRNLTDYLVDVRATASQ